MKKNPTPLVLILVAGIFGFTSCKKDAFKAPAQNVNTTENSKQAAISLAVNFYKTVTGTYGGAELKDGIKVASVNPAGKKGPVVFSTNPLCGYVIDTVSNKTIINDTTNYHYGGSFSFTYTCSSTVPDGYITDNAFFTRTRTTNTRYGKRY